MALQRASRNQSHMRTGLRTCRFFIEFVFESIPQTILQTYIYHQLNKSHLAGGCGTAAAARAHVCVCVRVRVKR